MGLYLEVGLQTDLVERTPEKNASGEPSTQHVIEALVSVPSLLQAHPWFAQCQYLSSEDVWRRLSRGTICVRGLGEGEDRNGKAYGSPVVA